MTDTINDDNFTRGAATDLMEQVGDALAAPRVASVAGEKSMWRSPEKGVRTKKKASQVRSKKSSESRCDLPLYGSAPDHTRPKTVDRVGDHISSRGAKVHGVGEACAKHQEK